jgi:hypothetical protein
LGVITQGDGILQFTSSSSLRMGWDLREREREREREIYLED